MSCILQSYFQLLGRRIKEDCHSNLIKILGFFFLVVKIKFAPSCLAGACLDFFFLGGGRQEHKL